MAPKRKRDYLLAGGLCNSVQLSALHKCLLAGVLSIGKHLAQPPLYPEELDMNHVSITR